MGLTLAGVFLLTMLVALSLFDLKHMILPDFLTFPLLLTGLIFSWWQGQIMSAVIGAIAGYLVLLMMELSYKKLRGVDGIGRGDAKLLAAGGAWCGWFGLPFIVLLASASGLAHAFLLSRKHKSELVRLPFGPHLAFGIFTVWLVLFVYSPVSQA